MEQQSMATHGHWQIKSLKAKAARKRSLAEKMTDKIVGASGSFWFLALNMVWFGSWIAINLGFVKGAGLFDPYPFGMLTTVVSLEAIVLSILVLISQNRSSRVGDLREEVDLQMDVITEKEITKTLEILTLIAKKQGIDLSKDEVLKEMMKPVDREKIEHVLQGQMDNS